RSFVERDDARPFTAGGDNQAIPINQRRFAYQPLRVSTAEILEDVPAPGDGTVRDFKTGEISSLGKRIEPVGFNGRSAPGCRSLILTETGPQRSHPNGLAVSAVQAEDRTLT